MSIFLNYPALTALVLLLFLGAAMYASLEGGRRAGRRRLNRDPQGSRAGWGTVEGSLYGLFGLMLAFTFAGAAGRYQTRAEHVFDEAKVVRTAWRQLELLPEPARSRLRDRVRQHVSEHLKAYAEATSIPKFLEDMDRMKALEDDIWSEAVAYGRQSEVAPVAGAIRGSLIDLFETRAARTAAIQKHPPFIIYGMLISLGLVCAFMIGFGMAEAKTRSWLHIGGFLGITTSTMYIILDLEFPRVGLIRVDAADETLRMLLRTLQ
jgi:hypothetical protein